MQRQYRELLDTPHPVFPGINILHDPDAFLTVKNID